ncbi:MAG: hypothetical protein KatS3mg096_477 [Candidatus Parcubacteria bacterium]|nr:MAG: hypothetical protein KatS3mg096_477 [Candidatus Parcubacteria bacterium]
MRSIENIRKEAEDLLSNIQQIARRSFKGGRKPELPEKFLNNIKDVINEVIDYPENSQLIGILPEYRQEFKQFLRVALEKIAAELKRQNILEESIFNNKDKLRLLAEMLIINLEEIASALSKKLPLPPKILENAKKIAVYQDYEFINKFINSDEFISQQLNIPLEEVREIFTRSRKIHFAIYNISNPLEALQRVKYHLEHTLTDENITNIAISEGFTIEEAENLRKDPIYKKLYTLSFKIFLAIRYKNPEEGVRKFLRGEI